MASKQDMLDFFEERAAIYEYEAGYDRAYAELLAKLAFKREFKLTYHYVINSPYK